MSSHQTPDCDHYNWENEDPIIQHIKMNKRSSDDTYKELILATINAKSKLYSLGYPVNQSLGQAMSTRVSSESISKSSGYLMMVCRHWGVQCWSYSTLSNEICKEAPYEKWIPHRTRQRWCGASSTISVSAAPVMTRAGILKLFVWYGSTHSWSITRVHYVSPYLGVNHLKS